MSHSPTTRSVRKGEASRGWTTIWTLAATTTVSWGVLYYAFSVALVPMQEELGWSRVAVSGAFSVGLLVSGLASPLVGRWIDRRGPRALMTAGAAVGAVLILAWSTVGQLWVFYTIWAGIGLAMAATLYEPAFVVAAKWFEGARLQKALLAITVAAGFASTIFVPISAWLVGELGWRVALAALAAVLAVLTVAPHALVLRRPPAAPLPEVTTNPDTIALSSGSDTPVEERESVTVSEALGGAVFWLLTAAYFLGMIAFAAMNVHLIAYLVEIGYGIGLAATVAGLIGVFQVLGRVLLTLQGVRASTNPAIMGGIFVLQGVALVILLAISGMGPLWLMLFIVPFGAASGAMTLSRASLFARLYGAENYGGISGMSNTFMTLAMVIAPVGVGAAYGITGGYEAVFAAIAVGSVLAAIAVAIALQVAASRESEKLENRQAMAACIADDTVGDALRAAMRKSASPVAVVTASGESESRGITVSSLTSVSLEPALVLFTIRKEARMQGVLATADRFYVHLLGENQAWLAGRFAAPAITGQEQFEGLDSEPDGEPRLQGVLATLTCVPYERFAAGDHLVVLGKVVEIESGDEGGPLLFHDRSYRRVGEYVEESRRDPRTA